MTSKDFFRFSAEAIELRKAYRARLADAQALLEKGCFAGAVLMATYAIEILLKCLVCKAIHEPALPRAFHVHDLEGLLVVAGVRKRLNYPRNSAVKKNWQSVVDQARFALEYRYQPDGAVSKTEASDFLVKLTDSTAGVIPWLERNL